MPYVPPPSLPLTGSPPDMTGPIHASLGSAATPSYSFAGHNGDGFFWDGTNSAVGFSATGIQLGFLSLNAGIITYRLVGDSTTNNQVSTFNNAATVAATYTLRKAHGSQAAPALPATNDQLGRISFQPLTNTSTVAYTNSLQIQGILTETSTVDPTHVGSQLRFTMCPIGSGTLTEVARLDNENGLSMFGANPVIDANRVFRCRIFTVATLPTGVDGMATFVSDSNVAAAGNFGAVVAGGGTNHVPVYFESGGSAWRIG